MSNLMHLIYASRGARPLSKGEIVALLRHARGKNSGLNITGMLLYDEGSFLQVLEGEEAVVNDLFAQIAGDDRHDSIVTIINEAIPHRQFADWSMGYAELSRSELGQIDGMNDFFEGRRCLADIDSGRAKKILDAFAKGRWRLT